MENTRTFKCNGCGKDRPCVLEINQEPNCLDHMVIDDLKCVLDETNQTSYKWVETTTTINIIEPINDLLANKRNEMVGFLNDYLSPADMSRIGHDIVRIMPDEGDIAKIQINDLIKLNPKQMMYCNVEGGICPHEGNNRLCKCPYTCTNQIMK